MDAWPSVPARRAWNSEHLRSTFGSCEQECAAAVFLRHISGFSWAVRVHGSEFADDLERAGLSELLMTHRAVNVGGKWFEVTRAFADLAHERIKQLPPAPPSDAWEWTCPRCAGDVLWCGCRNKPTLDPPEKTPARFNVERVTLRFADGTTMYLESATVMVGVEDPVTRLTDLRRSMRVE